MPSRLPDDLSRAAATVGEDMLAKCAGAPADARVTMPVDEFRQVARLLRRIAAAAEQTRSGRLDEDGFRFWVPLPQLEAQRRELRRLRARASETARADAFRFF